MTLETVSGAMLLLFAILIPIIIAAVVMIAYSFQYWREKRKEHNLSNTEYFKESYNEPYKEEGE